MAIRLPSMEPTPVDTNDGIFLIPPSSDGFIEARADFIGNTQIPDTVSIINSEGFELTVTTDVHERIKAAGFSTIRTAFELEEARILADPHGEDSIDAFKDTDAGKMARLVHRVVDPTLQALVPDTPLALKGTGLDMHGTREYLELGGPQRTSLHQQFRTTLEAARLQQEQFPNGIADSIRIVPVFGYLGYGRGDDRQEWMLMERVVNGNMIETSERQMVLSRGGVRPEQTFDATQYPALATAVNHEGAGTVDVSELAEAIASSLGYWGMNSPFRDLNSNNILETTTNDTSTYNLIDVGGVF